MNFALSAELEDLIRRKVASGAYHSAAQVMEEALLLLEERDQVVQLRRERLLRDVAAGIADADNHQLVAGGEVFKGLVARANASDE